MLSHILHDIRNTFRTWRRNPGGTLAALATLTIGIGATTTIFSVLSSLLLAPLPLPDADHLLRVIGIDLNQHATQISMPDALDIKQRIHSASGFAIYQLTVRNLPDASRPVIVHVLDTDADFLRVMGVHMAQGSGFHSNANEPGHYCEVVLSWPFWQSRFGGRAVLGKSMRISDQSCVIDGILPKEMDLPVAADVLTAVPFDLQALANGRRIRAWFAVARLNPGVTVQAFNSELASISQQLSRENPEEDSHLAFEGVRLRDWLTGSIRTSVFILFAAVWGILLIACANVANLQMVRAAARVREISVRGAVGASRAMLLQQLLVESLILALLASCCALLFTLFAIHFIGRLPNINIPRPESITVDWRVLTFAIGAACLTTVIFGLLPAWRASAISLNGVLKQAGGRMTASVRQRWIRQLLVASETAIATVLLITSLLLLHSFQNVANINPGFDTGHLLTAYLSLPPERYGKDTMDLSRFAQKVVERLIQTPGIQSASVATNVPLQTRHGGGPVQIEGQPPVVHEGNSPFVINTVVSCTFRDTLGVPLLAGRDLVDHDDREEATAVLVNATFARTFFSDANAVGKRLRVKPTVNPGQEWQQIAGVIGDTRQDGLEGSVQPEIYVPLARDTNMFPAVIIRTVDSPASHLRDIENAVHRLDPEIPIFSVRTMQQVELRGLALRTFNTALLTAFASVALLLASVGIFAVIAYSVSQRTSEIGTRLACGATRSNIVFLIMRQGTVPAFLGIAVGVLLAFSFTRYLASMLYGVESTDLVAYAGAVMLLAVVALAASLLPALRAARIDPGRALRYE